MSESWSVQARTKVIGFGSGAQVREKLVDEGFIRSNERRESVPPRMLEGIHDIEIFTGKVPVGGEDKPTIVVLLHVGNVIELRFAMTLEYEPEDGPLRSRPVKALRRVIRRLRPEAWGVQVWREWRGDWCWYRSTEQQRALASRNLNWIDSKLADVAGFLSRNI